MENPWQVVKGVKRRKTFTNDITKEEVINLSNRYTMLTTDNEDPTHTTQHTETIPKPPPIFVYGVVNYQEMKTHLQAITVDEQYTTRSMANNTIKINCALPDTYRKLVKYFNEKNIIHHTYQPKEERAYRIVIKYLHHSMDTNIIKEALASLGHKVRNIINAKHRHTKEPMNLFFVDLEPSKNNIDIYNVHKISNCDVLIEPPRGGRGVVQCTRCQLYGHTKSYCNRPFVCVRCGGAHSTANCKKSNDTPATCALCGGPHPANYRGCEYYHRFYKQNQQIRPPSQQFPIKKPSNDSLQCTPPPYKPTQYALSYPQIVRNPENNFAPTPSPYSAGTHHGLSYAQVVRRDENNSPPELTSTNNENTSNILIKFLEEFKNMFNQLIQQNSIVLNMLTTLIAKK
jgi:arsenate reductase-like glutaredoxin family protein